MSTETQTDIVSMVERWIRHELPLLNRSAEAHGEVQFLMKSCEIRIDAIAHAARDVRDPDDALKLLQLLAFAVSSVERHLQAAGAAPGDGVHALRVTPMLLRLSEIAGHAPRDSQYTYWLRNQGDTPLTFTGSCEETMFIRVMNEMHHLQSVSVGMLRPLCNGDVPITSRMSVEAIEFAAANHDRLTMLLYSMLHPAERRRSAIRFEMFAMHLGTYLSDYPVGMQTYLGPDPSTMPAAIEMDLVVGPRTGYAEDVRQRMPLFMRDDRERLEGAMKQRSLAIRIAEAAGLTEQDLLTLPADRIADHIALQPWLLGALKSFAHLASAVATSGSYFSVVRNLFQPATSPFRDALTGARTLAQPIDFDTLPQVVAFERNHPAVERLVAVASA